MFRRIETRIGDFMVCVKVFFEFAFVPSTILASIIIPFPNFISEKLPTSATKVRQTPSPVIMLIAPIFLTTKCIIALPRAEMVFYGLMASTFIKADRLPTIITRYYRESGIISRCLLIEPSLEINSIAGSGTSPSNFSLSTIGNKFFSADFAYQLYHTYIIPQHSSFNQALDFRPKKKAKH